MRAKIATVKGVTGPSNRKNDCSVRAYATLNDISYEVSEMKFAKAGRKFNKGVDAKLLMKAFSEKAGWKLEAFGTTKTAMWFVGLGAKHVAKGMTLKSLMDNQIYKTGKHAVLYRGHIFALIDGIIYDNVALPANVRITAIFSYVGTKE